MLRSARRSGAAVWVAFFALSAGAPAQPMPTAAPLGQMKILDLVFHVESTGTNVENAGGRAVNMTVKESRTELRIDLASDVLFDFDSAVLLPKARKTLESAAQVVRSRARGRVRILGYTDAKGSAAYNTALSQRRARSVESWFVEKDGLRNVRFETSGLGARDPVAPNTKPDGSDNPDGRRKNRRVEILIAK
jgi:outer membrane protein OmpA-like peptidoglycan-associated protein